MAEYSAVELADRFEEMVDVLNRMPPVIRKQKMVHWPDYPNDPISLMVIMITQYQDQSLLVNRLIDVTRLYCGCYI